MKEPLGLTGEQGIGVDLSWDSDCFDVDFGICAVESDALGGFGEVVKMIGICFLGRQPRRWGVTGQDERPENGHAVWEPRRVSVQMVGSCDGKTWALNT